MRIVSIYSYIWMGIIFALLMGCGNVKTGDCGCKTSDINETHEVNDTNETNGTTDIPIKNAPPLAVDDTITMSRDNKLVIDVLKNDSDSDGSLKIETLKIVKEPVHGVATLLNGKIVYMPDDGYVGGDSLLYTVEDNKGLVSNQAAVFITIKSGINSLPIAKNQNLTMFKNRVLSILLVGVDEESNRLNYIVTTKPMHGSLSGVAPNLLYTPDRAYVGKDSFRFKVNDGMGDSAEATISITIKPTAVIVPPLPPTNKAPVAVDDRVTTKREVAVLIDVLSNDRDSDGTLDRGSVKVVSAPTAGVATVVKGKINYRPKRDYVGKDYFTYRVKDNKGLVSNEATVSVTINKINSLNNRPIAEDQNLTIERDMNLSIALKGRDVDGDKLSYHIVASPRYGILSGLVPDVIYTPNSKYVESDCFTFKVNDGVLDSEEARVAIVATQKDKVVKAKDTVTIEELSLYVTLDEKHYRQPIIGKDSVGDLSKIGVTYEVKRLLDESGYGLLYVTLKNGQSSDLEGMRVFFFLDASIEEKRNTFFNEYGEYVDVRGEGAGDIYADYWQIDEPDYLNGHIVDSLHRGVLDNRNHIERAKPNDVSMALGFDMHSLKSGEGVTFVVRLSSEDIGGLSQIDRESGSRVYYDVREEDSSVQRCMNR